MALVACPDCEKQVSDAAPSCPGCGRPMAATVIEQTNKGVKNAKIIGGIIFLIGLPALLFNPDAGLWILLLGVGIYVAASFSGWYKHG